MLDPAISDKLIDLLHFDPDLRWDGKNVLSREGIAIDLNYHRRDVFRTAFCLQVPVEQDLEQTISRAHFAALERASLRLVGGNLVLTKRNCVYEWEGHGIRVARVKAMWEVSGGHLQLQSCTDLNRVDGVVLSELSGFYDAAKRELALWQTLRDTYKKEA